MCYIGAHVSGTQMNQIPALTHTLENYRAVHQHKPVFLSQSYGAGTHMAGLRNGTFTPEK